MNFYRRFWPHIRRYKFYFAIVFVATIIAALATAFIAYLIKPVLDDIFINHDEKMLVIVPLLLIATNVLKASGVLVQTYFMNFIGLDIVKNIRNEMMEKMLLLDLAFFNFMRNGELISRITNDIAIIRLAVSHYFTQGVQEGITLIALAGVVIYQNPRLAIFGLIVMPLSIYPLRIVLRKIKKLAKSSQEKNSDITAKLSEIFNNIEIIKANNGEKIEILNFAQQNEQFSRLTLKTIFLDRTNGPLMEILGAVAMGAVIFLGGSEVMGAKMSPGEFFSFMTALFMMYGPIKKLVNIISASQEVAVASERIFEILDRAPQIIDGENELKTGITTIQILNATLFYENTLALRDANIIARRDEVVAFVGKSGSGKTSATNLILRLYDASAGQILIDGKNIKNFTQKSIRDEISLVSQRIFIFNDSVRANVAYGTVGEINDERVEWALREAMAWDFVAGLNGGTHAILDEFGTNLSGGQRQRIAIARALYKNPSVLILDEATSALDTETEELIKQMIVKNSAGKIVILIAHRPSTLELAHRVYEFDAGRVKER